MLVLASILLLCLDLIATAQSRFLPGALHRRSRPLFRADSKGRKQPLEVGAVARRTFWSVMTWPHQRLELVAARPALKVIQGHG